MRTRPRLRSAAFCGCLLAAAIGYGAEDPKTQESDASHGHAHDSSDQAHGHDHGPSGQAKADDRQSNDRQIEITAEGGNLWHLTTKSRLVKMRLVERDGKTFAEFLPFAYDGAESPFAADNTLSLEIDPGTDHVRTIPLLKDGKGGRLVTATALPSTAAFDAALHMDEKDHVHRLRFRFPGAR
ncbi:MAG: hypothetical protein ACRER3_16430 [Pseudomonas fluorescens]